MYLVDEDNDEVDRFEEDQTACFLSVLLVKC